MATKKTNVRKVATVRAKKPQTRTTTTRKKPTAKKATTTKKVAAKKPRKPNKEVYIKDGSILIIEI